MTITKNFNKKTCTLINNRSRQSYLITFNISSSKKFVSEFFNTMRIKILERLKGMVKCYLRILWHKIPICDYIAKFSINKIWYTTNISDNYLALQLLKTEQIYIQPTKKKLDPKRFISQLWFINKYF